MLYRDLTREHLHALFERLAAASEDGIPGVMRLDGPQPGPCLGLMAMTHGNEPAGLAAFHGLLENRARLRCGTVYLILNNLAAGRRYFEEATDLSFTAHYRFIDQDMNRMPVPETAGLPGDSSEIRRVNQLLPLYRRLDAVLDLHSTSAASAPMLIETDAAREPLQVPGVNILLRGILPHLVGQALVSLCERARGYVIECGSHEEPAALVIAQQGVWRMLETLGMTEHRPHAEVPLTIYTIEQAVIFPDDSYQLERLLSSFECLPAGTVLASGDGPPIVIARDSWVIMPPPRLKPVHPGSEFLYLATRSQAGADA